MKKLTNHQLSKTQGGFWGLFLFAIGFSVGLIWSLGFNK